MAEGTGCNGILKVNIMWVYKELFSLTKCFCGDCYITCEKTDRNLILYFLQIGLW